MKIDAKKLSDYCKKETSEILGKNDYVFIDNGANILAVCHADTVADYGKRRPPVNVTTSKDRIESIALDDRLGMYIILEILPKMGINVDVLITDDEEIGMSTAGLFRSDKKYNWIFSFDRKGVNPVLYQYEEMEITEALLLAGIVPNIGAYSDICDLEILGAKAINFGTGYNLEHSANCFAMHEDIYHCVAKFSRFYNMFKDTKFEHGAIENDWDTDDEYQDEGYYDEDKNKYEYDCFGCGLMFSDEDLDENNLCLDCQHVLNLARKKL